MKKEISTAQKKQKSEKKSIYIFIILSIIAAILIAFSAFQKDWIQNFLLSLGTGAATSALVSLAFYLNDKEIKKRESIKYREMFMDAFRIFYYKFVQLIDFSTISNNIYLSLEQYIKLQHCWFHEYYKRMIAENSSDEETEQRVEQMEQFINSIQTSFYYAFEFLSCWKQGDFTNQQLRELSLCYTDFKNMQLYLEKRKYQSAFLEFADFLECNKRIIKYFDELDNFNLFKFHRIDNVTQIEWGEFEKAEHSFGFARSFNKIREDNYKKYYSYHEETKD